MDSPTVSAVFIQDVCKSFGFRKSKLNILQNINLNVPKGITYGLLGPSGCGKTTLLKCIIGRLKADKGIISVLGQLPGSEKSKVPGSDVGYMPQELAAYDELNIAETLTYVGRVYHMKRKHIQYRIMFLLQFLQLPNKNKLVRDLSGGQQRRVSFAMALIHEPPLLILDEPTVGVDPILRESIWDHLIELCASGNVTVIITTHYIEEARKATRVGLMRNGRILAEDEPGILLKKYNLPTLEEVYLKLCRQDDKLAIDASSNEDTKSFLEVTNSSHSFSISKTLRKLTRDFIPRASATRISALTNKNILRLLRRYLGLVFTILTPVVQVFFFCLAVGGDVRTVDIAVLNEDYDLGTKFFEHVDNSIIHQIPVSSIEDGEDLIVQGKVVAFIDTWQNFTPALEERFKLSGKVVPQDVLQAGTIHMAIDGTDPQTNFYMERMLYEATKSFADKHLVSSTRPEMTGSLIKIDNPIYGTLELFFTEFMVAGIMINAVFILAAGLVAVAIVMDKKTGALDRTYVLGVNSFEIMWSYILSDMIVVILQVFSVLLMIIEGFDVRCEGSIIIVCFLTILQGLCGVAYGWLVSIIADSEMSAMLLTLGSFYPFLILSGTLWPIRCANKLVQFVSPFMPQTLAVEAVRWIMLRGRDITWEPVWLGFVSTTVWTIIFLLLSAIVLRIRRLN